MHAELTVLLEIQDLMSKARELEAGGELEALEERNFGLDASTAIEALRAKAAELAAALPEPVRRNYERIAGHVDRVVVPVLHGTCHGCFVSVATALAGETDPNAELQSCEHCGRFLYFPG